MLVASHSHKDTHMREHMRTHTSSGANINTYARIHTRNKFSKPGQEELLNGYILHP